MRHTADPAASPWTWLLATVFLVVIDVAITHSWILWAPTTFENTRDVRHMVFAQTYQAARKLYVRRSPVPIQIALLGNSRILLGVRQASLEAALHRLLPTREVQVTNLGIFGAAVGDLEVLSRHVGRLHPTVVVLAINGSDLAATQLSGLENLPGRLLRIGWRDGPLPPDSPSARVDRWGRTIWPLYRFREFARAAIADRLLPTVNPGSPPDFFPTRRSFFHYQFRDREATVERAYRAWRRRPTLAGFVAYLDVERRSYVDWMRKAAAYRVELRPGDPAVRVLDRALERLSHGGQTTVLLMPENPILQLDVAGEYHRAALRDDGAELIHRAAERYRLPVIDARHWMPAEAFFDFDHLFPDLSGFEQRLALDVVRVLQSRQD